MNQKGKYKDDLRLDFIGVGIARAGTTWLAQMLAIHPDIFIPSEKELNYFNRKQGGMGNPHYNKSVEWYAKFFKKAKNHQLKGEISPHYFQDLHAAKNIHTFNPDIKLIVLLRNPVDQLFSRYLYSMQLGVIKPISFEKAIILRSLTLQTFYKSLKRFFTLFPRKNIKVAFYDDLRNDPVSFLKDIQFFLNVKPFIPQTVNKRVNISLNLSHLSINLLLYHIRQFLKKIKVEGQLIKYFIPLVPLTYRVFSFKRVNTHRKPQINEKLRQALVKFYIKDIENIENLLGKNLNHWKT